MVCKAGCCNSLVRGQLPELHHRQLSVSNTVPLSYKMRLLVLLVVRAQAVYGERSPGKWNETTLAWNDRRSSSCPIIRSDFGRSVRRGQSPILKSCDGALPKKFQTGFHVRRADFIPTFAPNTRQNIIDRLPQQRRNLLG